MSAQFAGAMSNSIGAVLAACLFVAAAAAATGGSGGVLAPQAVSQACGPSGLCYGLGTTNVESLRHLVGLTHSEEEPHEEKGYKWPPRHRPPPHRPPFPRPPKEDDDDDDDDPKMDEKEDGRNPGLFALFGLIPVLGGLIATLGSFAVATVSAVTTAPPPPPLTGAPAVPALPPPTLASAAVAAALSNAILAGDIEAAAQVLIDSDDLTGLVQGLQIPPGVPVGPSFDRNSDGDVVAVKAIALAVLSSADPLQNKLATVTFQSVILPSIADGTGFTLDTDTLFNDILDSLSDPDFLNQILQADANETLRRLRRRLLCVDCTDSASWVCNFCWPADFCIDFWFCKPVLEDT